MAHFLGCAPLLSLGASRYFGQPTYHTHFPHFILSTSTKLVSAPSFSSPHLHHRSTQIKWLNPLFWLVSKEALFICCRSSFFSLQNTFCRCMCGVMWWSCGIYVCGVIIWVWWSCGMYVCMWCDNNGYVVWSWVANILPECWFISILAKIWHTMHSFWSYF